MSCGPKAWLSTPNLVVPLKLYIYLFFCLVSSSIPAETKSLLCGLTPASSGPLHPYIPQGLGGSLLHIMACNKGKHGFSLLRAYSVPGSELNSVLATSHLMLTTTL